MWCHYDVCGITGEIKKEKYVYYRCTGYRGKCDLPRFREQDIANRLGEPLKGLQVPAKVVSQVVATLREDQKHAASQVDANRTALQSQLTRIRSWMDAAYTEKLEGKIPDDFWERKMIDWRKDEQQVKIAIQRISSGETEDRARDALRTLELANTAYSLYISHNPHEKAKLLKTVLWNYSVDAVTATPIYRKPFDMISKRAESKEWWTR